MTPAVRALRAAKVEFVPHLYRYVERGGVAHSSAELGWDPHRVIKTLVMRDEAKKPLVVLMHGDLEVSTRGLARQVDRRSIEPCAPAEAQKHSGYLVGGTSPFGLRTPMPVMLERTILDLPRVLVNGGKRGFLVEISPSVFSELLSPTLVEAARE